MYSIKTAKPQYVYMLVNFNNKTDISKLFNIKNQSFYFPKIIEKSH